MSGFQVERKPWYRRIKSAATYTALGILVFAVIGYVVTTARYVYLIKQGKAIELRGGSFSVSTSNLVDPAGEEDRAKLESGGYNYLGRKEAPLTIVAFVDYKCPNSYLEAPILKKVAAKYGPKVKLVMRDFPADQSDENLRPGATHLALMARCSAKQGRYFWATYDLLFAKQAEFNGNLSGEAVRAFARESELSESRFVDCINEEKTFSEVSSDYILGVGAGVRGTPTYFVNGEKVEGVVSYDEWERYIDAYLPKT